MRTARGREAAVILHPMDRQENSPGPLAGHPPGPTSGSRYAPHPQRSLSCSPDPGSSLSPSAHPISSLGDVSPPSSPLLLHVRPWGPGCLSQAGQGNAGDGRRDGQREPLPAVPRAQPSTQDKCSLHLQPRTRARQESRLETDWARLCPRPKLSSDGAAVTVHLLVTPQPVAR